MAKSTAEIAITEDRVVIRPAGSSQVIVAMILGRESRDGVEHLWLDRLLPQQRDYALDKWDVTGAISTVLIAKPFIQP